MTDKTLYTRDACLNVELLNIYLTFFEEKMYIPLGAPLKFFFNERKNMSDSRRVSVWETVSFSSEHANRRSERRGLFFSTFS